MKLPEKKLYHLKLLGYSDELDKLIEYIQDYYAPLNIGMKEFISVDEDAAKLFSKIRSLNISDDEVVDKLISTGILTDNLSVAITAAERKMAITEFENAIALEKSESYWQTWFEKNKWVLGSEYLNILPERDIDVDDIADYGRTGPLDRTHRPPQYPTHPL